MAGKKAISVKVGFRSDCLNIPQFGEMGKIVLPDASFPFLMLRVEIKKVA